MNRWGLGEWRKIMTCITVIKMDSWHFTVLIQQIVIGIDHKWLDRVLGPGLWRCQCSLALKKTQQVLWMDSNLQINNFWNVFNWLKWPCQPTNPQEVIVHFIVNLFSQDLQLHIMYNFSPGVMCAISVLNFAVLSTTLGRRRIIFGSV